MSDAISLMRCLAAHYCIDLTIVDESTPPGADHDGRSYSAGNIHSSDKRWPPMISIGIYANEELRLLSFFHELGHCVDDTRPWHTNVFDQERAAWDIGYRLAAAERIEFSGEAQAWARAQLETYNTPEYRW